MGIAYEEALENELRLWKLVARDYYKQWREHYNRYVSDAEMEADLVNRMRHYKRIEELKC